MSFLTRRLRHVASTLLAACAALSAPAAFAIDESDLLPVEQAFVLTADAVAPDRIEVRWVIADGYYLYRHRTDVQAVAPATAGKVSLPDGEPHEDEFFGKTETYRERLVATLPGVKAAVHDLRNPVSGRLDGELIRLCFGLKRTELAKLLDVTPEALRQTPDSPKHREKFEMLEQIADDAVPAGVGFLHVIGLQFVAGLVGAVLV